MKKHTPYTDFHQDEPLLINEYTQDEFLKDYLETYLPSEMMSEIRPDLERFGKRVATELIEYANACENNPPQLISYNAWGERVDEIKVAPEWKKLEDIAAEEGLVAIGYERKYGSHSRLYQFAKLYLYTPSSAIYTCPLAMSDGAARLIEKYGDDFLKDGPYKGLISRNPATFLTSGQWMTERTGGSDVSRSMTFAYEENGEYILRGHKWFTSAITANMAFTLASTEQPQDGKRAALSLFFLPIRNEDGTLNGIEVEALKDKLGTRALPTAQLNLTGTNARLVGEKGKGVKSISTLFNVTRIYNAISSVSYMRRAYALSESYSHIREAFGKKISEHILHRKSLKNLEIAYQSNTILPLFLSQLLGKEDCKEATDKDIALLRILTPIAKLYTAKSSIQSASEHIEMFGGLGYLEDTNIPVMLRNVQTLSIWEGTTNILSLDMLRAIEKDNGLPAFLSFAKETISAVSLSELQDAKIIIDRKIQILASFISQLSTKDEWEASARDLAFYIGEASIALLWLDFIQKCPKENYFQALNYWVKFKMNENTLDV
ncbi:MAG: acyl-CoA dehydrogenase family protein [Chitinophagales bacterium]|nr:acyl-CoA dehydrogenase family protein [Chitinophagales bacterium]MCZ2394688.1 acyl-CoA dehydrogenase family protein [Chitinophagales bacterium]